MFFDGFIKNLIYDPVSSIGILIFYLLLINLPISLVALFNKKSSSYVRLITILINLFIALQLISRWIVSGHFPISNLYESLYFLIKYLKLKIIPQIKLFHYLIICKFIR